SSDGVTTQTVTVTITGTNDIAVVAGDATGAVTEDATAPNLTDTGTLTITDADTGEAGFDTASVVDTTAGGALGSLSITSAGVWTYTVANTDVQYLKDGETKVETFTVDSADGATTQTVTVTITGTNDIAVVAGDATGAVTEDATAPNLTDSGTLTITDSDTGEAAFDTASVVDTTAGGALGGLSITSAGVWTYTVANADVQYLGAGETKVETFTVDSSDGATTQTITVTITGTNDIAVVSGTFSGAVSEGNIGDAAVMTSGTMSISDVDTSDSPAFSDVGSTVGDNGYGSFVLSGGNWTYTLDQSAVQDLDAGDTVTDTITYTATDGTVQAITITITGTNDTPVVAGTFTGAVDEGNIGDAAVTATGTLSISDVDADDSPAFNDVGSTVGDNGYGSFVLSSGNWTYTLDESAVQDLDAGDTVTDTITYTATDGTAQAITVTITGTDDVSVLSVDSQTVDEDNVASGNVLTNDIDVDDTLTVATFTVNATTYNGGDTATFTEGSFTLNTDGSYTFTPDANWSGDVPQVTYTTNTGLSSTLDITVTPVADTPLTTATDVSGNEGTWISLAPISASLVDVDGSETLGSLTLDNIPDGASVTDGTNSFTASSGSNTLDLTGWNLANLQFMGSSGGTSTTYSLTFSAIATESANSDTASNSGNFNVEVFDTAPVAVDDTDSLGYGGTVMGNVITGVGGTGSGSDTIGADTTVISQVAYSGTTYTTASLSGGAWTITAASGTLVIDQSGNYTYTSTAAAPMVSDGSGNLGTWNSTLYGFDAGTSFVGGGKLDLSGADVTVAYRNGNGLYLAGGGDGNELDRRSGNSEAIAIDLGELAVSAQVILRDIDTDDGGTWRAYDASGDQVGTGTFLYVSGGNNSELVVNINPGSNFQYLVFTGSDNNDEYNIWGLTYEQVVAPPADDVFTYTLSDADGDTSAADLTISHDTTLAATDDVANVDEAGLPAGTEAGVASITTSGNLIDNDLGIGAGASITNVDGQTATGGVITVNTAHGTLTVYAQDGGGHRMGDYTYTLTSPSTDGVDDVDTVTYTVQDSSGRTGSADLSINIVDDAPFGSDVEHTLEAASGAATYNLVIILDRSGSMGWDANGLRSGQAGFDPTTVRMDIAKDALEQLIEKYDGLGNVNVQIVDFSNTVNESAWFVDDKYSAIDYINGVNPNGNTYYSTALNAVMTDFNPPAGADKTIFYFISDGEPTAGYEATGTVQTNWESFVGANGDISFGIGIGEVSLTSLLPVAFPNVDTNLDGNEDYAIKVTDATQLVNTLLSTVDGGIVVGNVSVLTGSGESGLAIGADGGYIQSVEINGTVYSYDPLAGDPSQITIDTPKGAYLDINFVTGAYSYYVDVNATIQGEQETFLVTGIDNDGDTHSVNMTFHLDYVANLDANRDVVITNILDSSDISIDAAALMHNDATGSGAVVISTGNVIGGTTSGTDPVDYNPTGAVSPGVIGQFNYTIDSSGTTDTATVEVHGVSGSTITGSADDEILVGGSSGDTLIAAGGMDALLGHGGDDSLDGGAGSDYLDGGLGNDTLSGGEGKDTLIGGGGDDTITGGLGVDTIRYHLADPGTPGTPAVDTVTDFNVSTPENGGDILDLRDLLQSESQALGNLVDYLHFEQSAGNTIVHISSTGGFGSGYVAGAEDQTIILQGIDLVGSNTDLQIIQDMITNGKLITD
ncbi:MAG: VCBS domain-containing protein, partial [Proteobacteria bacterium]|nr:VCBS domain-containing protein [Pseudomonadota bacterium]MBU1685901.1 VCBS domain-containing protein [Pseudomonadota bacterium]